MSSAAVTERPIFKAAEFLRELVRRNRAPGEPTSAVIDVPPYAPTSSFVTINDEVIECEVEA